MRVYTLKSKDTANSPTNMVWAGRTPSGFPKGTIYFRRKDAVAAKKAMPYPKHWEVIGLTVDPTDSDGRCWNNKFKKRK